MSWPISISRPTLKGFFASRASLGTSLSLLQRENSAYGSLSTQSAKKKRSGVISKVPEYHDADDKMERVLYWSPLSLIPRTRLYIVVQTYLSSKNDCYLYLFAMSRGPPIGICDFLSPACPLTILIAPCGALHKYYAMPIVALSRIQFTTDSVLAMANVIGFEADSIRSYVTIRNTSVRRKLPSIDAGLSSRLTVLAVVRVVCICL